MHVFSDGIIVSQLGDGCCLEEGSREEVDHQGGMPEQAALAPAPRRMPCRPRSTSMSLSVLRHLLCMALLLILAGCDGGNLKTASGLQQPSPCTPGAGAPLRSLCRQAKCRRRGCRRSTTARAPSSARVTHRSSGTLRTTSTLHGSPGHHDRLRLVARQLG